MNWSGAEWQAAQAALEQIAMLGTDRKPLSAELRTQLETWGFSLADDEAEALLQALLQQQIYLRSNGATWDFLDTYPSPIQEKHQRAVSAKAAHLIDQVLEGGYPEAMPELLTWFKSQQLELPPAGLPKILERSLTDARWWEQIQALLGERAFWLIQQNPRWAALAPEPDLSDWPRLSPDGRLRRFQALRQTDPADGAIFLAQQWSTQSRQMQIKLLAALSPQLQATDAAFLTKIREGTQVELRAPACRLLVRLEPTELHRSLLAFVQEHLFCQNGAWSRQIPPSLPTLLAEPPFLQSDFPFVIGERFGWLVSALSLLDPAVCFPEVAPAEAVVALLESLDETESEALVWALAKGSKTYGRSDWARALLQVWVAGDCPALATFSMFEDLVHLLSEADYQDLARLALPPWPQTLAHDSPGFFLLTTGTQAWDAYTAKFLLQSFQNYLIKTYQISWTMTFYRDLLLAAAFRAPFSTILEIEMGWPQESPAWGLWEDTVHRLNQTAKFRQSLKAAIDA